MAWVYILKDSCNNRYYIGSTNDLSRRLKEHKQKMCYTTKRFEELELAFSQEYEKLQEARIIERKLKNLKRKDYIEKIIKDGFIKIKPH